MVGITRSKVTILLIPSAQFERCLLKNQDPANPSSNRRMAPILAALTLTGPTCIVAFAVTVLVWPACTPKRHNSRRCLAMHFSMALWLVQWHSQKAPTARTMAHKSVQLKRLCVFHSSSSRTQLCTGIRPAALRLLLKSSVCVPATLSTGVVVCCPCWRASD